MTLVGKYVRAVSKRQTPEELARGFAMIRAMFAPDPEEVEALNEDMRIIEKALGCYVSDYERMTPDPDVDKAKALLARMRA